MADGALNQSMDEILAQIRKIISEEPGASATPAPALRTPVAPPAPMVSVPPAPRAPAVHPVVPMVATTVSGPVVSELALPELAPRPHAAKVTALKVAAIEAPAPAPAPTLQALKSETFESDDLSDLLESEPSAAIAPDVKIEIEAAAPALAQESPLQVAPLTSVETPSAVDPMLDLIEGAPSAAASPAVAAPPLALVAKATPLAEPAVVLSPDLALAQALEPESPAVSVVPTAPPVAAAPAPIVSPIVAPIAAAVVAAAPAPVSQVAISQAPVSQAPVSQVPVSLASMFANRLDDKKPTPAGLLVPSHIGRSTVVEPKPVSAPLVPTGVETESTKASAVTPAEASAPVGAAVEATVPLSNALGALAAGLAASGLASSAPAAPVVLAAAPPVVAPTLAAAPAAVPDPAVTTDQIMDAIQPLLKDWFASNMPRLVDGALKEALPDLIAQATARATTLAKDAARKS